MSRPFALPDLGEGLTEAEIIKVLVREGDVISEDSPLLEVETDKATVEIPSPFSGRVAGIHVQPGQTVKVGHVLVTFEDAAVVTAAADASPSSRAAITQGRGTASGTVTGSSGASSQAGAGSAGASGGADGAGRVGPVPATPATRRLARELGVDLGSVRATGPGGRVTDDDVRAAGGGAERRAGATAEPAPERAARPLKTIGVEPALPRFEQWGPVEREPLSHLRRTIAERMTLSATVVPHVTHFDRVDVTELEDLRGGTFTITNLGALGGTGAIPIINYPEVAILGVSRAREEPVVQDGRIVPRRLLPISLTFDHRVADGADGARFAAAIVRRLERPEQL